MPLQVIPVITDEDRQRAYALRFRVFIDEQKFDPNVQIDHNDPLPTTFHFLGRDTETGKFIATARCIVADGERKAEIGRVAVLPEYRGKKYGAAMMIAVEHAMRSHVDEFVLMAQSDKLVFYKKCGYVRVNDEVTYNEGVAHCWMRKCY